MTIESCAIWILWLKNIKCFYWKPHQIILTFNCTKHGCYVRSATNLFRMVGGSPTTHIRGWNVDVYNKYQLLICVKSVIIKVCLYSALFAVWYGAVVVSFRNPTQVRVGHRRVTTYATAAVACIDIGLSIFHVCHNPDPAVPYHFFTVQFLRSWCVFILMTFMTFIDFYDILTCIHLILLLIWVYIFNGSYLCFVL